MADESRSRSVNRRRFLTISAAAAGSLLVPGAGIAAGGLHRWQGIALGARAEIVLNHPDRDVAEDTFFRMENEIRRLEAIFSLYEASSELSRLNARGKLDAPSPELLELLAGVRRLHDVSAGAFDPTIQPLWALYATRISAGEGEPTAREIDGVLKSVGFGSVGFDPARIHFAHPGSALTFNGIAQGFITDRVTQLLKSRGFSNVLVDLGEIAASGRRNEGTEGWNVTIRPGGDIHDEDIVLKNRAIATSAASGTTFDQARRVSHILDPRTGRPAQSDLRSASVIARTATLADGLSTAALICGEKDTRRMAEEVGDVTVLLVRKDGQRVRLEG